MLALADRQIVVDAGANAVLEVKGGKAKLLSVIPKNGKAQPVPTSIALGPDGDYYVGELAEGAGKGKARVFKVPAAGGAPSVHAKGFTAITGVAFGSDGSLYVTEFARNLRKEDARGRVVRIAPDGSRSNLGVGQAAVPDRSGRRLDGRRLRVELQRASRQDPEEEPVQGRGWNAGEDHTLSR